MVKVFVAQTQKEDRELVCDFLTAAGHDVQPHLTDPLSRIWLMHAMSSIASPFVLVASQRDDFGCQYVSNILHAATLTLRKPTLTIVYSRSVGHQGHMPGVIKYLHDLTTIPQYRVAGLNPQDLQLEMMNLKNHSVKMVPKIGENTAAAEHGAILTYIDGFEASLK